MQFTTRQDNGYVFIRISGAMYAGAGVAEFQHFIAERLKEGCRTIIINLEGVKKMSNAGSEMLYSAANMADDVGGKVFLCHASSKRMGTFFFRLFTDLPTYPTEADVCDAVGAPLPIFGSATS